MWRSKFLFDWIGLLLTSKINGAWNLALKISDHKLDITNPKGWHDLGELSTMSHNPAIQGKIDHDLTKTRSLIDPVKKGKINPASEVR